MNVRLTPCKCGSPVHMLQTEEGLFKIKCFKCGRMFPEDRGAFIYQIAAAMAWNQYRETKP